MQLFGSFLLFVFLGLAKNSFERSDVVVIGKPEFECRENGDIVEIKSETTKIKLPENSQALFSINTERALNCMDSQICTIMSWKVIRDLEKYLKDNFNNTGVNGVIEFRNDMLIPGFNYLLHVTLKRSTGKIEEMGYNITFFNNESNEKTGTLGQLDLNIGTSRVYSTLPLVINANVNLCRTATYYYFRWSVITDYQEIILPEKSSELSIIPSSVQTSNEESCIIQCKVVEFENNTILLENAINIYIIDVPDEDNNEVQVFLPFKFTTINRGEPISIGPYIYNFKDLDYKTEWLCMFENTLLYGCQGQINTEFYMESGFNHEGNYSITFIVRTGNIEKTATCNILILADVPSIEFDLGYPIRPELGIEIRAKISDLRTYCTVQWFGSQNNRYNLEDILGLTAEVYNISSKDKSFLEEMVELGNITVSRGFKLKIPAPSRTWTGLESKNYQISLTVNCPSLQEINDVGIIKDQPDDFRTITGQTEFFVPPSPKTESIEVVSEDNKALSSEYYYRVQKSEEKCEVSMLFKYGYILKGIEVVFYSGINIFSSKTVLPYNEDFGIETYVDVCDYQNRCRKNFGPLVKPELNFNLDENNILKKFRQKLVEEDFYAVFSYAFIVLHSSAYLNESQKYSSLFSSELSIKVQEMLEGDSKLVVNNFLKNLVTFIDNLKLSNDLMIQLSQLTHEFLNNFYPQSRIVRHASRNMLSFQEEDLENLEEIQNYMKTSEYLILNPIGSEVIVEREKEHMITLLDRWMVQACSLLFKGHRVPKVEMRTMIFTTQKISQHNLNKFITVPFDNNAWNMTTQMKINNLTPHDNQCLGLVMLKNFFSIGDIIFGANIYFAENKQSEIHISAEISIFLPTPKTSNMTQCTVYKNGWILNCLSSRQYITLVECICPTFGYYFLNSKNNTFQEGIRESANITESNNNTNDEFDITSIRNQNARRIGEQISYVIIGSSLVGFVILCYIIRKLTIYPQHNIALDGFNDSHQYGNILHDDLLE